MTNETTAEHVLTITNGVSGSNSDLWIADSGAMSHMTNSLERMYDITDVSTHVKVGDGKHINMVRVVRFAVSSNSRMEAEHRSF